MNQGKLEMVKQEMARVNIDILGIREVKWTGMGEFNSDDHYIYYCGQESLRRNGVAIRVNRRVQNAVLGCNLKNDRMISVRFQGKPFNITVIQVYALTSSAEEAEVEQFYEDLQDLLELTPPKDVLLIIGDWNAKVGSQETPGVTGKFGLGRRPSSLDDGGMSGLFSSGGPSVRFLTRYDGEVSEPLVGRQGSRVSMRVAMSNSL